MSLRLRSPLPSLEGITEWINGKPDPDTLTGSPLMVYFWAMSCHVCHQNMPGLQSWREHCVPKGLQMVSIHCPRMKSDTDIERVKLAVKHYGIVEPCGVDNMHKVKKAFENEFWPSYYLFTPEGELKIRTVGKNALDMMLPHMKKMMKACDNIR